MIDNEMDELISKTFGNRPERFIQDWTKRTKASLRGVGVTLCIPAKRDCMEETLMAAMSLVHEHGLTPKTVHSFEIANNRQFLLDWSIKTGMERMLFLDSDTVIDGAGFLQMMDTMDRTKAAMVSALVKMRETGEYNAWTRSGDNDPVPLKKEDLPSTGAAFPVKWCGLAAALIDLEQVKQHKGPQFFRHVEGYRHVGEDRLFCQWMEKFDLVTVVDPKVASVHVTHHYYAHAPAGFNRSDLEVNVDLEGTMR